MERTLYDLDNQIHTNTKIGRVQTAQIIPVVAGDSLDLGMSGIIRLSQMRQQLVADAQVDICYFYQPYRHIYGDDFVNFIEDGVDQTNTFEEFSGPSDTTPPDYLCIPADAASIPTWLHRIYANIIGRYFSSPDAPRAFNASLTGEDARYGALGPRLPHPATNPRDPTNTVYGDALDASDQELDVSGGTLNILELQQVRARYKSERDAKWFNQRYADLIDGKYGAGVNYDADERPELFWKHTFTMSGSEVDGTGDANLGDYAGKMVARVDHGVPRKFFPEHGAVFVLFIVRFPFVHALERHKLFEQWNLDYKDVSGDPTIWQHEPPVPFNIANYVKSASLSSDYVEPYGQHYRYHPNRIHSDYRTESGFPFVNHTINEFDDLFYHTATEYDGVFHTTQLGHVQLHAMQSCKARRVITPAIASIKVG